MRLLARLLLVATLCSASGAHWLVLQSVAWTSMVVTYAQEAPLNIAVAQTFDGAHPCGLCKVVRTGTGQDKQNDEVSVAVGKLKFHLPASLQFVRLPDPLPFEFSSVSWFADVRAERPPIRPPRGLFA